MEKNKKIVKPVIVVPIIFLIFVVFFTPHIYRNIQEKDCISSWKIWEKNICKEAPKKSETLTYSNLVDKATQEEIKKLLEKAGIKKENIENFFANVSDFNSTIWNNSLVLEWFLTVKNLNPTYDNEKNVSKLEEKYPDFLGHNCRITSFSLFKDLISVWKPFFEDVNNLAFDLDTLDNSPKKFLNVDDRKIFESYFSYIPTPKTKNLQTHLKSVKDNFVKKEIKFLENKVASLVSVYFHDIDEEKSNLFIWHVWVLLKTDDSKFIFLEKLSFQEPYQAVKFETKQDLVDYLMNKYDVEYWQENANPFIMENAELIEGFRYNKDKKES